MILSKVVEVGGRLDLAVCGLDEQLTRSRASALVRGGRVQVDGQVVSRPATKVREGAEIVCDVPPPDPAVALPQDLPLEVVYQDEHLAVIHKAPGMVVHPGPGHRDGTLVNALLFHLDGLSGIGGVMRPGIVHRLDKGTSGLMVVAKTDAAHQNLSAQFAAHTAGRRYLALCMGAPKEEGGTITSRLARHGRDRQRWSSTLVPDRGKEAITHWRVLGRAGTITLIGCQLETGRTHQVRVHLCEQGWPLVGDTKYTRRHRRVPSTLRGLVDESGDRPLLHAAQLHLVHPESGEPMGFSAAVPQDLREALEAVGIEVPTY